MPIRLSDPLVLYNGVILLYAKPQNEVISSFRRNSRRSWTVSVFTQPASSRSNSPRSVPQRIRSRLIEHDRFVAIAENAVLHVPHYSPRQDGLLDIPALLDEILHLIAMRNSHHILFDDRAVVERRRHVVARGADQFDSTLECRMVRPGAYESRQERMVYVDDPGWILRDELGRQNLHVPGQHDQVDTFSR